MFGRERSDDGRTMFPMAEVPAQTTHELVLRRIAHGARLVGLGWWALLSAVVGWEGVGLPYPWWTLAVALLWAAITSVLFRTDPFTATWRPVVLVDLVLACFSVLAVFWADAGTLFYGGFPLIVVIVASVRSRNTAWLAAAVLAALVAWQLGVGSSEVAFPVSQVLVYPVGAAIAVWTMGVLRRSQSTVAEAQAVAVRAEEREEISRHLHDSVLQTLALVQRNAGRPEEVIALARRQERELRDWLYGAAPEDASGLDERLRAVAADVEERYRVAVDVVTVGEAGAGLAIGELVAAAREAMVNAAKHSSVATVAVFGEADERRATVYVRDRGIGFDPESVGRDRRGIRESIVGRLERVGGRATVRTDRGTEWKLEVRA